jgi:hypothetical protein
VPEPGLLGDSLVLASLVLFAFQSCAVFGSRFFVPFCSFGGLGSDVLPQFLDYGLSDPSASAKGLISESEMRPDKPSLMASPTIARAPSSSNGRSPFIRSRNVSRCGTVPTVPLYLEDTVCFESSILWFEMSFLMTLID